MKETKVEEKQAKTVGVHLKGSLLDAFLTAVETEGETESEYGRKAMIDRLVAGGYLPSSEQERHIYELFKSAVDRSKDDPDRLALVEAFLEGILREEVAP